MSDTKPSNVFQLGGKRPSQAAAPSTSKLLVDQDPTHVPTSFSQELNYMIKPGTEQEVVEGVKAVRSHFLKLLNDEGDTLPMLILENTCQFPGLADRPAAELQNLRRRFKWTVDTYFGLPNKICKRLKDLTDGFLMQVRLLMFTDKTPTGHRLADDGKVSLILTINEFGVAVTMSLSGYPDHSEFIPHFAD